MTPPDDRQRRAVVAALLDRVERVEPLINARLHAQSRRPRGRRQVSMPSPPTADHAARCTAFPCWSRTTSTPPAMLTTAGSLALADSPPPRRTPRSVARLREAGMVVARQGQPERVGQHPRPRSTSGWSAYGGLTRNPYGAQPVRRAAPASGSGAAVAAGLARFAIGTETDGSITCPAAFNGCVGHQADGRPGRRPGSRSRSRRRRTPPGPMAATVAEAAALLGVLTGDGADTTRRTRADGCRASGSASPARCSGATALRPTRSPRRRSPCCRLQVR